MENLNRAKKQLSPAVYEELLELAKIYIENNRKSEGADLLNEIYAESQYMTKPNRRIFGATITEVERLLKTL